MPPRTSAAVAAFLAELPADRRRELEAVRAVVRRNLPAGYEEALSGKLLVWQVPLEAYPDTYNGHPLWYTALASQKNYLSLYLMNAYGNPALARLLREGFKAAGKKLDMGKSCVRFRAADDLALDVVGEVVASTPMGRYITLAKSVRRK
jgi:maltooligosyltrehalose synthase